MARKRDKRGRFLKRGAAATNPERRRRTRHHKAVMNPVRRHTSRRRAPRKNAYFANPKRRRRSYRHNPIISGNAILGMTFKEIGYAGIGFIAPPAIEGFVKGMLPASITSNNFGRYAIKGGIVAGVSLLGGKFLGREAGKYLAIGGVTYLVANLVVDFVPQIFGGFSGYKNPGRVFAPSALRGSPLLGKYMGRRNRGMGTAVATSEVPSRLNPDSRL